MPICFECNGCIDNTCTECDDVVNPCASSDCTPCTCTTPAYTNVRCPDHIKTDCSYWSGDADTCVGLVPNVTTLTSIITLIITYIKNVRNRILNSDGSLTLTPIDDDCDDKLDIKVKIDSTTNSGDNTLTLTGDGLYVPPFSGTVVGNGAIFTTDTHSVDLTGDGTSGAHLSADVILDTVTGGNNNIISITTHGVYAPPPNGAATICGDINSIFTADVQQQNDVDTTTYDFLILDNTDSGCNAKVVSPPLGFAVTGSGRSSAFGSMEWYSTLAAAITAASSGESVLLYEDSTDALILKAGVNFQGIGDRIVSGILTINANTVCKISNITFSASTVTISGGLTCKIFTNNVTVMGAVSFRGNVYWKGGIFLDNTKSTGIIESAEVSDAYFERSIGVGENGKLTDSKVVYSSSSATYGVYMDNTVANSHSIIRGCSITTGSVNALMALSIDPTAKITVMDCIGVSDSGAGIYLHDGFASTGGTIMAHGVKGYSNSGVGLEVVSGATFGGSPVNNCHYMITNCYGYSVTGNGITTINGNLKGCYGFSEQGNGIETGGSDNHTFNLLITECIGESIGANGIKCDRDCFILGGTYISMLNSSLGNPINITNFRPSDTGYMIVGAKTHAFSPLAYAIKGVGGLPSIRISGCQFTNQSVLGGNCTNGVLGIDPLLTLRSVCIDAYGNAR